MSDLSHEQLLELYRQMALIRRFEEKAAELYTAGKIGGFLHLYIGEEAIATGACQAMRPDDHLLTAYRDHGWAIARGLEPRRVMAEMLGKATGVVGGKGGSMHMASAEHRYWGGHAIIGAHLPIATGVGLAIQYEGKPEAVVCVFGEGSTNIGYFHESVNLAAVWNLPVVFLVENNQYGMGTAVEHGVGGQEDLDQGPRLRHRPCHSRRPKRAGGVPGDAGSAEPCTYKGALLAGGRHIPLFRPLDGRPGALSQQGRDRPVALTRPDRALRGLSWPTMRSPTTIASRPSTKRSKKKSSRLSSIAEESPEPDDVALCEYVYVDPQGHK